MQVDEALAEISWHRLFLAHADIQVWRQQSHLNVLYWIVGNDDEIEYNRCLIIIVSFHAVGPMCPSRLYHVACCMIEK